MGDVVCPGPHGHFILKFAETQRADLQSSELMRNLK